MTDLSVSLGGRNHRPGPGRNFHTWLPPRLEWVDTSEVPPVRPAGFRSCGRNLSVSGHGFRAPGFRRGGGTSTTKPAGQTANGPEPHFRLGGRNPATSFPSIWVPPSRAEVEQPTAQGAELQRTGRAELPRTPDANWRAELRRLYRYAAGGSSGRKDRGSAGGTSAQHDDTTTHRKDDMNIRGETPEERERNRTKRAANRRVKHYAGLIRAAGNPRQQLGHACDYLRAVAARLQPAQTAELTRAVTKLADRWSQTWLR
jgi:hypothetical protein